MVNQALVDFIRQNAQRYSIDQLKQTAIQQGYSSADVEEAANFVTAPTPPIGAQMPIPPSPQRSSSDLFNIDQQTKETMTASAVGLVIAQLILFFGDFLIGKSSWIAIVSVLINSVIGGAISGFLIAKFYYSVMDFISSNFKFLLPLTNTFFKLLFVPILIGSVVPLLLSLAAGAALYALGSSVAGATGGIVGGLLGGSIVMMTAWAIIVTIVGRYIYAKYMVSKVGQYYKNYKQ